MGMHMYVKGFKAPDEKWKAMKSVYDSCEAAGIEPPAEVNKYFEYDRPDDTGVEVEIKKLPACKEYSAEMIEGYEVDLKALPKDITHIRFCVSY